MDERYDIVVVGAGLAGLTAAATAAQGSASVLVLDSRAGGGGRAVTDQVGRFRFNRGAHALYRTTPGREVLRRLGVTVRGVLPPQPQRALLGDKVGRLPTGGSTLARTTLLGRRDKLSAARLFAGARRWKPRRLAGTSAAEWFDDLGIRGTLRQLVEAFTRVTTYLTDLDVVSADVVAGQLQAAQAGSVDYVEGGWETLVHGLTRAARRAGVDVSTGRGVQAVLPEGRRVVVELDSDTTVVARRVVLAAGGPDACAALLPEAPASWERLGPPSRVACLDLGLATPPTTPFLLGIDRPMYLSRHAPPPAGLAPPGGAVVQTMLYLRQDEDPTPDDARGALEEHCRLAGIDPASAEEVRYLHRMVACTAIPVAAQGGLAGRPRVDTGVEGVLVAGDWVGPQGYLADAALVSGEQAGRAAVEGLERQGVGHAVA